MDWWSNASLESKRVCPLREKNGCPATFGSYRLLLAHCRRKHPDKPPPTTELVMMDNQGRALSWEEVGRMRDHPCFGYGRKGTILPGEEVS
jgi:hypothetical protein